MRVTPENRELDMGISELAICRKIMPEGSMLFVQRETKQMDQEPQNLNLSGLPK